MNIVEREAAYLFARYAERLTQLAEQHLSSRLAGCLDGEDIVQSVFRTFFRRSVAGEFHIDSSAEIWQLLVRITVRKVHAKAREHTAGRRNVAAEVTEGDDWLINELAHDPGPAEAAALVDQIEHLLSGLPTDYARVLEMRLAGYDVVEIAKQLGVSRRTIHRMLNLLQDRLASGGR